MRNKGDGKGHWTARNKAGREISPSTEKRENRDGEKRRVCWCQWWDSLFCTHYPHCSDREMSCCIGEVCPSLKCFPSTGDSVSECLHISRSSSLHTKFTYIHISRHKFVLTNFSNQNRLNLGVCLRLKARCISLFPSLWKAFHYVGKNNSALCFLFPLSHSNERN